MLAEGPGLFHQRFYLLEIPHCSGAHWTRGPRRAPQRTFTREVLRCHHPRLGFDSGCGQPSSKRRDSTVCARGLNVCLCTPARARMGCTRVFAPRTFFTMRIAPAATTRTPYLAPSRASANTWRWDEGFGGGVGQSTVRKQAGSTQLALTGIAGRDAVACCSRTWSAPSPPGAASALLSPPATCPVLITPSVATNRFSAYDP